MEGEAKEIIQIPGRVIMLFERDHIVRQIYTDGRGHPKDLNPTYMGDSIGKWEGDTLVIDTIGFNDRTWVDQEGHPHTENLHVLEHLRRVNHNTLEYDFVIDDPEAYENFWTGKKMFELKPGWSLAEYVCVDNLNWTDLRRHSPASSIWHQSEERLFYTPFHASARPARESQLRARNGFHQQ